MTIVRQTVEGPEAETASAHDANMRLLVSCPDRPGIVAAVSRFLFDLGANILRSDQHTFDPTDGTFFLRTELRACREVGIEPFDVRLPATSTPDRVAAAIGRLNRRTP
jgi:formyltetrahydrofolate hydrolase